MDLLLPMDSTSVTISESKPVGTESQRDTRLHRAHKDIKAKVSWSVWEGNEPLEYQCSYGGEVPAGTPTHLL